MNKEIYAFIYWGKKEENHFDSRVATT